MKRAGGNKYLLVLFLPLCFFLLARIDGGLAVATPGTGRTIGLLRSNPDAFEGYTLFAPISATTTFLIDMNGELVHSWPSSYPAGNVVYLLENGNLLRTCTTFSGPGGSGGRLEEINWDGSVTWELDVTALGYLSHHDVERLPNGDTLVIAWEVKTKAEAVAAGRDPAFLTDTELWPDTVIEVTTGGGIVWEWHAWDHLSSATGGTANGCPVSTDITDPGRLNINFISGPGKDWLHVNAIDYNPDFDQIVISSRSLSEIYVIDHSTVDYSNPAAGIAAAAGSAGDILYRWGNPRSYGAGGAADQQFYGQHDSHWIEAGLSGEGNIMVFNNGDGRGWSSIDEIVPPVDEFGVYYRAPSSAFGPAGPEWTYFADPAADFYASHISGAQRLPNGNTLICSGVDGRFFEITPDEEVVWEYINPVNAHGPVKQGKDPGENSVFRCYRYPTDYAAFAGRDLTPAGAIELPSGEEAAFAVFRPSNGLWAVRAVTRCYFGSQSDIPASSDYDGDGETEIAVFRPTAGLWAVRGLTRAYFGSSGDLPVPADYDGDGSAEIALFRESSGLWAIRGVTRYYYGTPGDLPVPSDYDGDGTAEIALFRESSGLWAVRGLTRLYFGSSGDTPSTADYDGDGSAEAGVFRDASGLWSIRGITRTYFGTAADQPLAADYDGDLRDDITLFRDNAGLWAVRGITRIYFGTSDDVPVLW